MLAILHRCLSLEPVHSLIVKLFVPIYTDDLDSYFLVVVPVSVKSR